MNVAVDRFMVDDSVRKIKEDVVEHMRDCKAVAELQEGRGLRRKRGHAEVHE
jgi:hypothetical protein